MGQGSSTPDSKTCKRCGRPFTWRPRLDREWDRVQYCSSGCRRARLGTRDKRLEAVILELVRLRGPGRSICPSEVARAVNAEDWRALLPLVRYAINRLAAAGAVEVTQRGQRVDASSARGPIRVRLGRGGNRGSAGEGATR